MNAVDVLRDHKNFAVIGATDNQEKYGYKIISMFKKILVRMSMEFPLFIKILKEPPLILIYQLSNTR